MTSSIQNLQGNVARLQDINVGAEGIRTSLNAQLAQDQEAFVTAITARFQQTMQDSLAASEARQKTIIDSLRAENLELKHELTETKVKVAKMETDLQNLSNRISGSHPVLEIYRTASQSYSGHPEYRGASMRINL